MMRELFPLWRRTVWGGEALMQLGYCSPGAQPPVGEVWMCGEAPGALPPDNPLPHLPFFSKVIHSAQPLSLQVHPDQKSEFWYILHAQPDAFLYLGTAEAQTPEALAAAAKDGTLERLLHRVNVRQGDCFYIPPGLIHAIGGGIVLWELQSCADITYRLYDYNRTDAEGKRRALHIRDAVCAYRHFSPEALRALTFASGDTGLCCTPHFSASLRTLSDQSVRTDSAENQWFCIDGQAVLSDRDSVLPVRRGTCVHIAAPTQITCTGTATFLIGTPGPPIT